MTNQTRLKLHNIVQYINDMYLVHWMWLDIIKISEEIKLRINLPFYSPKTGSSFQNAHFEKPNKVHKPNQTKPKTNQKNWMIVRSKKIWQQIFGIKSETFNPISTVKIILKTWNIYSQFIYFIYCKENNILNSQSLKIQYLNCNNIIVYTIQSKFTANCFKKLPLF